MIYTCSMHRTVREDMRGLCPTCGMALIEENNLMKNEHGGMRMFVLRHWSLIIISGLTIATASVLVAMLQVR